RRRRPPRCRTARSDSAPPSPAAPEPVSAGWDAGQEHKDRGDDGHDARKTKRDAQGVDERRKQDGNEDSDHERASPSISRIDTTSYIPGVRDEQSSVDDLGVAVLAVQAAAQAAQQARSRPLKPRAKSVAADLVTEADAVAERAAAHVIA